jgi:hypothetical protein
VHPPSARAITARCGIGVHWALSRYHAQVGSQVDSDGVTSSATPLGRPDNSGARASSQREGLPHSSELPRKDTSTTELRSVRRPFVSFLTTAYQTEDYLAEMIDSVLAQTSADWELVIVDNGLSDAVAHVVDSYRHDPRIRLVRQQNRGYRGGVMAAAAVALGQYVCVLDSDDMVMPAFVATIAEFIEHHPEVDAVGCDAVHYDESDLVHLPTGHFDSLGVRWQPGFAREKLTMTDLLSGVIPYYTGAVRREVWDAVGGYAKVDLAVDESETPLYADHVTDVQMWIRLVQGYDVRLIDARLGWCRIRRGSLSRDKDKVEAFEVALINTLSRAGESAGSAAGGEATNPIIRRVRFHQELRRARGALLDGDIAGARQHARQAFSFQPGVRAAVVVASLAVSPTALRRLHPYKQHAATWWRRVREHRIRGSEQNA